jgi:hypothetical protein
MNHMLHSSADLIQNGALDAAYKRQALNQVSAYLNDERRTDPGRSNSCHPSFDYAAHCLAERWSVNRPEFLRLSMTASGPGFLKTQAPS